METPGDAAAQEAMLRHFVASAFAYDKPEKVAVAVSGGGDSIALLHLMARWAKAEGIRLYAVTVDHGIRPEAAQEAAFAAEVAQKLGVKHTTLTWDGWQGAGNLQDAARRARYSLMSAWAKSAGIDTIALAHTANDQAETFFMRLSRASGIDGLVGMQRRRQSEGITWVRPLLMQDRFELRQYLRALHQPWIDDPSNEDDAFDRIKARRALEELSDLGIDIHVVGRVMDHLGQVRSALDIATHDHAIDCVEEQNGDLIIDRRVFSTAAPEVNRRLVARALRWISSADYGPRGMKLQEFLSAILRGKDATLHGVRLMSGTEGGPDHMRLTREYAAVAQLSCAPAQVWDGRWRVDSPENTGGIVRALGDDGLAQLPKEDAGPQAERPPRDSLKSSPAVFDGNQLISAPLAGFGPATAQLIHPKGHFFTSLLTH